MTLKHLASALELKMNDIIFLVLLYHYFSLLYYKEAKHFIVKKSIVCEDSYLIRNIVEREAEK